MRNMSEREERVERNKEEVGDRSVTKIERLPPLITTTPSALQARINCLMTELLDEVILDGLV